MLNTYSTTGALEAAYAQAFGNGISLSEQQLVDCAGAFNNFGCNGGLPSQAFEYIKYNGGLDTEEAYPYTGKDGACKFSSENVAVKVLDSVNITLVKSIEPCYQMILYQLINCPLFNTRRRTYLNQERCESCFLIGYMYTGC